MSALMILALGWLWLREERARKAWLEDPGQPWNVQIRIARESLEWCRQNYRPPPSRTLSDGVDQPAGPT